MVGPLNQEKVYQGPSLRLWNPREGSLQALPLTPGTMGHCSTYGDSERCWSSYPRIVVLMLPMLQMCTAACFGLTKIQSRTKVLTDPLRCKCRVKWNCRLQRRRDGVRQQLQCCSAAVTGQWRGTTGRLQWGGPPTCRGGQYVANTDLACSWEVGYLIQFTLQSKLKSLLVFVSI